MNILQINNTIIKMSKKLRFQFVINTLKILQSNLELTVYHVKHESEQTWNVNCSYKSMST